MKVETCDVIHEALECNLAFSATNIICRVPRDDGIPTLMRSGSIFLSPMSFCCGGKREISLSVTSSCSLFSETQLRADPQQWNTPPSTIIREDFLFVFFLLNQHDYLYQRSQTWFESIYCHATALNILDFFSYNIKVFKFNRFCLRRSHFYKCS